MDLTDLGPDCAEPGVIEQALRTMWVVIDNLEWSKEKLNARSFGVSIAEGKDSARAGSLMHMAALDIDVAIQRLKKARMFLTSTGGGDDEHEKGTA